MALVPTNSTPENPRNNLEVALHEYEQVLTIEERSTWRTQAVPEEKAFMSLVTAIDRDSRGSHCVGPRLTIFLESVQSFTAIVDTFVSSHPEIAALLATNGLTYFTKLSQLFMRLGMTCPRINELAHLYPSSKRLQKALSDYYAATIRLCKHILIASRKSTYIRLALIFLHGFEAEFGKFETDLESLSKQIVEEASVASKKAQKEESQLQAQERDESRLSRRMLASFRDKFSQHDEDDKKWRLERDRQWLEKNRLQVLNLLSTYDYQKTFTHFQKECAPSTSSWVYEGDTFQSWFKGSVKRIWCTGRIGSGKSVICASVIAHIMETAPLGNITAYFFCSHDVLESLKAATIFRSIARQLANTLPAPAFSQFDFEKVNTKSILKFLEDTLDHGRQYFIVVDGFDECEKDEIKELTETFFDIMGSSSLNFKIYCSSRPNIPGLPLQKIHFERHIDLQSAENQARVASDIRTFIGASLNERLEGEVPELQISDPNLVLVIVDRLEKEAQGMFLWVKFQLQALCHEKSDSQILAALENLPPNLPQTFERILRRSIKSSDSKLVRQIFAWLAVAQRPLTLEELREAVGVEPFQESWDNRRFINNMESAVACCRDLVYVDEEQKTVHFAHNSVKQYLLSHDVCGSLGDYHIDFAKADAEVGAICVTYLSFSIFNTQIKRAVRMPANAGGIPSMAIQSVAGATSANKLGLALLHHKQHSASFIDRQLLKTYNNARASGQGNTTGQYSLLPYAERFWLEHTKREISPTSGKIWAFWRTLFEQAERRDLLSNVDWDFEDWQYRKPRVMRWIATNDHCTLTHLVLCLRGMPDKNPNDNPDEMPAEMVDSMRDGTTDIQVYSILLAGAAVRAHRELIEIIVRSGPAPQESLDSALYDAAGAGLLDIVLQLIAAGANINASINKIGARSPLQKAAEGGHLLVTDLLLRHDADVNAAPSGVSGRTALQTAAEKGHTAVVEQMIQAKANVNALPAESKGRTALQAAAYGGHLYIVNRLLKAGADVNAAATGHACHTALQAASEGGFSDVVERLLEVGAHVNAPASNSSGWTALQAAAETGHLAIVQRLLRAGANVNAPCSSWRGRTAIQGAAGNGHLVIVETLIQAGADVNAAESKDFGRTALQGAIDNGHASVIERLYAAGAHARGTLIKQAWE